MSLGRELLLGAGRLLNLWPRPIELPTKTDAEALREDWEVVERDLRNAIQEVAEMEKDNDC